MTTPATQATPTIGGRAHPLNRYRGKTAKRAAKVLWEEGHRSCYFCGAAIAFPIEAAMYRPPAFADPLFVLSDNTRAVLGHKVCPLPKR